MTTTAARQGSGSDRASGSMTKELRVPKLKVRVRPIVGVNPNSSLSPLPMVAAATR